MDNGRPNSVASAERDAEHGRRTEAWDEHLSPSEVPAATTERGTGGQAGSRQAQYEEGREEGRELGEGPGGQIRAATSTKKRLPAPAPS